MKELAFPGPGAGAHETEARVVKPLQFDGDTPQTGGMHRLAAVSQLLAGSEKLWAGVMLAEPNTASGVHHHGAQETVAYVAEGRATLRWGFRLEHEAELEPGDFLFIPPYLPHQEINPSADRPVMWIVVRSGPEAVVVDLAPGSDGEYVSPGSGKEPAGAKNSGPAGRRDASAKNKLALGHGPFWGILPAACALGLLFGVVFGDLWPAGQGWPVMVAALLLVLLGTLGILWA